MPGVLLIVIGADLVAAAAKPVPGVAGFVRADGSPARSAPRHALAESRVRFVGEWAASLPQRSTALVHCIEILDVAPPRRLKYRVDTRLVFRRSQQVNVITLNRSK